MLKPLPPRRVNNPVDRVSVDTWNRMVTCIEWLLKHLTPDNRTIYFDGTGQLTAKQSAAESSEAISRYLFSVTIIQDVDADGKTHTYANIYRVAEWIKVFGVRRTFPLAPAIIDITDALSSGNVKIGVKVLGFDSPETSGNIVCQYVINENDNFPLQPCAIIAVVYASRLNVKMLPYGDGIFRVDEFTGTPVCWPYYNNGDIKVVCGEFYKTYPETSAPAPGVMFDYPGFFNLFFTLAYNEEDHTYSGAWNVLSSGSPDGMFIPVFQNDDGEDMAAKPVVLNFFEYYLL